MAKNYDHKKIEAKWQREWEKAEIYKTKEDKDKKKCYVLDMFPYPSGEGLHVGHPKGYIATDVYSRFKKMSGFNILHPMGWDAFGLPAEQYAIKNKIHPRVAVEKNVARFKEQLSIIGLNYDWEREINTTDTKYYKWTQWIFLKLLEKGLAYESYEPINWCPSCQTGLANEDLDGSACERCGTTVEKKPMRQWVLRITDYADRLLEDLDVLDWPDSIKELQRNWIGRSEGALIKFKVKSQKSKVTNDEFEVFTTRPDTLFGATYCVMAPEHALLDEWKDSIENWDDIEEYREEMKKKTEIERTAEGKEKTGVRLAGVTAINPANQEELPVFIADYVLAQYGTGAIMAVPAHDTRDYEFAKKFGLPIREVISPRPLASYLSTSSEGETERGCVKKASAENSPHPDLPSKEREEDGRTKIQCPYIGDGALINSGTFSGMSSPEAKKAVTEFVGGEMKTTYKLREWVFSRQRYWGEPIPIVHCERCGAVPVPEKDLPVKLPDVDSYEPSGTGESPLANIHDWVNVKCPKCRGEAKRETNTMPQWAGSSWYYLRYIDPRNQNELVSKEKEKYWSSVDMYVGGAEHATRHLIYARFWHKFLFDIGAVNYDEPFAKLQSVGLIMAEDGRKMSKRWGNVINPDDIVETYGADTLRMYEMFMGPFDQSSAWSTESIIGPRRFLEKIWRIFSKVKSKKEKEKSTTENEKLEILFNQTIKRVSENIEDFKFNTAVSGMMIFLNELEKEENIERGMFEGFLKLLTPFAPHIAEELWHEAGNDTFIYNEPWPKHDDAKIIEDMMTIAVQVNGKLRATFEIEGDASEEEVKRKALEQKEMTKWVGENIPKKVIYVKNKLVSIVV
ncbi:MAG: leucine--tRNA ligase [Candidatus Paceibacterota bacterium]|jgi:leucyl-tRNA synthetase